MEAGEAARRLHSRWLSDAIAFRRVYPKIPLRRVSQGGFDELRKKPNGSEIAVRWWRRALARVDDVAE